MVELHKEYLMYRVDAKSLSGSSFLPLSHSPAGLTEPSRGRIQENKQSMVQCVWLQNGKCRVLRDLKTWALIHLGSLNIYFFPSKMAGDASTRQLV